MLLVDHRLGDGLDAILGDEIGKFRGFNAIGRDVFTLHGKLMGQAHRLGTVRSGRSDKDFQVDRLLQMGKLLFACRIEPRFAF